MNQKTQKTIVIFVIIIIILFLLGIFFDFKFPFVIGIADDYAFMYNGENFFDEAKFDYFVREEDGTIIQKPGIIKDGGIWLQESKYTEYFIVINKDFKTADFKTTIRLVTSCCPYFARIQMALNDNPLTFARIYGGDTPTVHSFEVVHSILDSDIVVIKVDGVEVGTYTITKPTLTISLHNDAQQGYGIITSMKYRVPFNCIIDENSIMVFDDFTEGSVVNLNELSYEPLRFCLNNPPMIRSFTEKGLRQDTRGEIFQLLVRGEDYTVKQGESLRLPYITKFVEGLYPRCDYFAGEAINTETGQCEQIITEEKLVIDGCVVPSDCFVPSNCGNIIVSCENNKCVRSSDVCTDEEMLNQLLVYQELLKQQQQIPLIITDNSFKFTYSKERTTLRIGDFTFNSVEPEYVCEGTDEINVRNPDCYMININDINYFYKKTIIFNDCVSAICYVANPYRDDWQSVCAFKINQGCVEIKRLPQEELFVDLNVPYNFRYTINNVLTNFDELHSGIAVDCERITGLQRDLPVVMMQSAFYIGEIDYTVVLDTSEFGKMVCIAQPYMVVEGDTIKTILFDSSIPFDYIVGEEPAFVPPVPEKSVWDLITSVWGTFWNFVKNLFGG